MASGVASVTTGVKVALFVAVIAVASFAVYRMVSKTSGGSGGVTVYTHLNDATGLVAKSRIKIAGISVGYIEGITLDGGRAKIALKVDKGIDLRMNATATKKTTSLLGEYTMVLTPGTPDQAPMPDGGEITQSIETPSTDKIMSDVAAIAEQVKKITTQAATAFGTEDSGKQMRDIVKNLADVSKQVDETVKENRQSVRDTLLAIQKLATDGGPRVERILDNVQSMTGDVKGLLEQKGDAKAVAGSGIADVRDTLHNIDAASHNLITTTEHADSILGRIDRGEGTIGRLTTDSTLIDEVEGVATDIHDLTSGISRVQTIVSLRGDYFIKSNGLKSFVELRLQPREDKYYLIELISDPRGHTSITQDDVTSTNPNQPPFYRTTTMETTNSFLFSFMFARRYGPATFLFGIRESSGGIGLNLDFFDDRLELRSDLFGFGQDINPHWRETATFEFVKRLFVVFGYDDILNADRRDLFFGAQVRFNDEDLKSILPFAPKVP